MCAWLISNDHDNRNQDSNKKSDKAASVGSEEGFGFYTSEMWTPVWEFNEWWYSSLSQFNWGVT